MEFRVLSGSWLSGQSQFDTIRNCRQIHHTMISVKKSNEIKIVFYFRLLNERLGSHWMVNTIRLFNHCAKKRWDSRLCRLSFPILTCIHRTEDLDPTFSGFQGTERSFAIGLHIITMLSPSITSDHIKTVSSVIKHIDIRCFIYSTQN